MRLLLATLLSHPLLLRLRRNHALEHGTIQVLSQRQPRTLFIGRSDFGGFFLYGEVETDAVRQAVAEAEARLRQGEHHLALHPNCGTTYLAAGVLASGVSFVTLFGGRRQRWSELLHRLPIAALASTLAVVLAQPLGLALQQRLTTNADLGTLRVIAVESRSLGRGTVHRIRTAD